MWFYRCSVLLEEGFSNEVRDALQELGHEVTAMVGGHGHGVFGKGQIIRRDPKTGVLWGGSDPRGDGQAIGW